MKPLNYDNSPCSPISSNCVIWQGPDLPCIKLCKGDTISDVVEALALELCTILDILDIKNYDLTCFDITACGPKDFITLIQFLIDRICALENINTTGTSTNAAGCPDCVVSVAPCFIIGTQTTMQLVDYVNAIGLRICSIITDISIINTQITSLLLRVTALEDTPPPAIPIPSIVINCNIGTLLAGNSYSLDIVLDQLINNTTNGYCSLIGVLGTISQIGTSLVPDCSFGIEITSNPNWTPVPTTVAESITNIWISICEIYASLIVPITVSNTNSITLDITSNNITANINDTGWVNLDGFTYYQAGMASNKPQCRRIGNQVFFRGTVYIPFPNGTNTGVQPLVASDTYRSINRGNTYIGAGGAIIDAQGRLLLNSNGAAAVSVIPTTVLDAGTLLDNQYVHSNNIATRQFAVEQATGTGLYGTVLLSAYVKVEMLTNKTLRFTPLQVLETDSANDNISLTGTSLLRNITSSFIGRSRVIDWATYLGKQDGSMSIDARPLINSNLIVGHFYVIENYVLGDDFTNAGAVANSTGQAFIATSGIPTVWANGSRLIEVTESILLNEAYASLAPSYLGSQFPTITDTASTGINAALATNLAGFTIDLDGLTVYVDPCTIDIKEYVPCP